MMTMTAVFREEDTRNLSLEEFEDYYSQLRNRYVRSLFDDSVRNIQLHGSDDLM